MLRAGVTRHESFIFFVTFVHPIDWKKNTVLHLHCLITVFFFYIDCKSWWSKPLEGDLILKAKCVMNKVINNNSEIRLKKRGWRWKNKREKGNWNPRGYISLIKINSLVIQTILLIPDKCFSFKNISNIKMTRTVYILNTEAMCPD